MVWYCGTMNRVVLRRHLWLVRAHAQTNNRGLVHAHACSTRQIHDYGGGDHGHDQKSQKSLNVALVGAPNAGKSMLLNRLLKEKVCILVNECRSTELSHKCFITQISAVTRKRHTTRKGLHGVYTLGDTQLVFQDTPGFVDVT